MQRGTHHKWRPVGDDPVELGRPDARRRLTAVLLTEDHDGVRLMTFNRPDRANAFNETLYHAAAEALHERTTDDAVGVVVFTGAGKAFCAGTDLLEMAETVDGRPVPVLRERLTPFVDMLRNSQTATRRGERRGGRTRVHHARPLRPRVRVGLRPTARALHEHGRRARSCEQLPAPAPHGPSTGVALPLHLRLDLGRGRGRHRARGTAVRPETLVEETWSSRHGSRQALPS